MNDIEQTETLLRKAPRLKVPSGLREKLQAQIVLPRAQDSSRDRASLGLLRRWLPALSLSAFFLACVIAIAVQSNILSELRRENASLRASGVNLEQIRQENLEYQKLRAETQQLERLRQENLELRQLQNEVARLRQELQALSALKAENQRLLTERKIAESRIPAGARPEEDPFEAARKKQERINCINNIKQIGLAARMWSNDHGDNLPPDFLTMSNELNSPRVLICPGDTRRSAALTWSEFGAGNVSYEIISPGVSETDPAVVYVRCPIHNNFGLVDGSAQMVDASQHQLVQKNGKWVIGRRPQNGPPSYE